MIKDEQKAYNRGYQAGIRKARKEVLDEDKRAFREAVFKQVLRDLMNGNRNWYVGDEAVTKTSQYVNLAKCFANEAVEQMYP